MNQTTSQKRYQRGNQAKRRQGRRKRVFLLAAVLVALLLLWLDPLSLRSHKIRPQLPDSARPEIDVELLTVNPNSRPGKKLGKVKGIVVHYTANPGSSAMDNRNYFEGLKDSHVTQASAHFIVGLKGRSSSAFRPQKLPMPRIREMGIPLQLRYAIRTRPGSSTARPMIPLCG